MNTLADELKEQEYLGYWWLPVKDGQQQVKRAGVIHFAPNNRAELHLLGSFEDIPIAIKHPLLKYPVIQGAAHGHKRITLFDCATYNNNIDLFESTELADVRIAFVEGWVGQKVYSAKDEIQFLNLMVGMLGLSAWHNVKAFESRNDWANKHTELQYDCPESVELFKDELVEIKLEYSWQPASQQLAQCEGKISHDPRILIKSLRGKLPYYGECNSYHFYLDRIRSVLGLMVGRGCPLYDCSGLVQKCELHKGDGMVPEIALQHLWRRDVEDVKPISPFDVWLPYEYVAETLKTVVAGFMSMDEFPAGLAGHLVYLNASRRTNFTQGVLPELVYMFEGLHKQLYCEGLSQRQKENIPLANRFEDEFSRIGNVFPFIDATMKDSLIEYVKDRRHKYSHANPDSYHENFSLYIHSTNWMRMFLTAMVLEYCGLPVSSIYTAFSKNHEYSELAAKIPLLLQNY